MTARWLPRLVLVLALLFGAGFCFHTSFDPEIFGKYTYAYFAAICCWFVIITPCAFLLARYLVTPSAVTLPSSGRLVITPLHKLLAFLLVGWCLVGGIRLLLSSRGERAAPWKFHPYLQTAYKPNQPGLGINRWGFRGEEIEKVKPEGTFRIFIFGGSTVACQESEFEKTHCRLLEQRLRKEYPDVRIEVQNLGVPWHGSEHSVIKLLFNIQDFDPDLVIIYHAMGDLFRSFEQPDFSAGVYSDDYGHYYGPVAGLIRGGRLVHNGLPRSMFIGFWCSDFRYDRVRMMGPEGKGIGGVQMVFIPKSKQVSVDRWRSLGAFERNMRSFVSISKEKKFDVLIASEPYLYHEDMTQKEQEVVLLPMSCRENGEQPDLPSMRRGLDAFNARSRLVSDQTGVRFFDLEKKVPKSLDYFFDDVHYTTAGNVAVADAFANEIIQWGLVRKPLPRLPIGPLGQAQVDEANRGRNSSADGGAYVAAGVIFLIGE